jgi:hypothetical protein
LFGPSHDGLFYPACAIKPREAARTIELAPASRHSVIFALTSPWPVRARRFLGLLLVGLAPLRAALPVPPGLTDVAAPPASQPKDESSVASITTRREMLQKEIAATREELAKLAEGVSAESARWLTQETALLERIDAVHAEQQRTWQHAADLAKEAADVAERTRNLRPPEVTLQPPYDLPLLDQLYAERDALEQAAEALKRDIGQTETMVQEARDILEEKDRERRAVRGTVVAKRTAGKASGNRSRVTAARPTTLGVSLFPLRWA